jgi:putative glutamine amidotransferase
MNGPLIGITTYHRQPKGEAVLNSLSTAYTQAVIRAGGVPLLLPVDLAEVGLEALSVRLDGLLLSGGGDVLPERYGGQPHSKVGSVDIRRDDLEITLVQMAARQGWPFLGICRGIQVLNVALGGTLYEDIEDQRENSLQHDYDIYAHLPRDHRAHGVNLAPDARLAQITDSQQFMVNSLHHQGLRDLAPDLRAVGWSPDGLVEAVELPGHPFGLGVQWHPECIPDSAESQALFAAFIKAASHH